MFRVSAGSRLRVRTHEFPTLNVVALDGSARGDPTRYLGSTSGVGRDVVVFDRQELRRTVGLYATSTPSAPGRETSADPDGKRLLDRQSRWRNDCGGAGGTGAT